MKFVVLLLLAVDCTKMVGLSSVQYGKMMYELNRIEKFHDECISLKQKQKIVAEKSFKKMASLVAAKKNNESVMGQAGDQIKILDGGIESTLNAIQFFTTQNNVLRYILIMDECTKGIGQAVIELNGPEARNSKHIDYTDYIRLCTALTERSKEILKIQNLAGTDRMIENLCSDAARDLDAEVDKNEWVSNDAFNKYLALIKTLGTIRAEKDACRNLLNEHKTSKNNQIKRLESLDKAISLLEKNRDTLKAQYERQNAVKGGVSPTRATTNHADRASDEDADFFSATDDLGDGTQNSANNNAADPEADEAADYGTDAPPVQDSPKKKSSGLMGQNLSALILSTITILGAIL